MTRQQLIDAFAAFETHVRAAAVAKAQIDKGLRERPRIGNSDLHYLRNCDTELLGVMVDAGLTGLLRFAVEQMQQSDKPQPLGVVAQERTPEAVRNVAGRWKQRLETQGIR